MASHLLSRPKPFPCSPVKPFVPCLKSAYFPRICFENDNIPKQIRKNLPLSHGKLNSSTETQPSCVIFSIGKLENMTSYAGPKAFASYGGNGPVADKSPPPPVADKSPPVANLVYSALLQVFFALGMIRLIGKYSSLTSPILLNWLLPILAMRLLYNELISLEKDAVEFGKFLMNFDKKSQGDDKSPPVAVESPPTPGVGLVVTASLHRTVIVGGMMKLMEKYSSLISPISV